MEGNRRKAERICNLEWRAAPKGKEQPSEPTAQWTGAEENSSSLGNINLLTRDVSTSPEKTFVHAISSYRHVYSFSSESCTESKWSCIPNHGSPRLTPVPNAYGAK